MHVMKMENIMPRAGIKPTSLTLWATVLPFHHLLGVGRLRHWVGDVTSIPTPTCLCSSLPQRSVQATTEYYTTIALIPSARLDKVLTRMGEEQAYLKTGETVGK